MRPPLVICLVLALAGTRAVRAQEDIAVETAPPVVVKTVPQAGLTDVDPALKEIRVTFSKEMADGSWSAAQLSPATFPKVDGKLHYQKDGRTFVLPVKLEPGRVYAIWLNSQRFHNFKDREGQPAIPYLLVFRTK